MANNHEENEMKKAAIMVFVFLLLGGYGAPVLAGNFTGNVNVFLGQKQLDDDDWGRLDDQDELGLLFDFAQKSWPINIAIDLLGSRESASYAGYDVDGKTTEFCVGVRKIFILDQSAIFKPYVGGGLAFIGAELEDEFGHSEDDNGAGIWLNAGGYFTLSQHFNIGLDLRYSKAEVTLSGEEVEAGGTHIGLILGYHW